MSEVLEEALQIEQHRSRDLIMLGGDLSSQGLCPYSVSGSLTWRSGKATTWVVYLPSLRDLTPGSGPESVNGGE
jgi:hypothetical protein